ncbi:MAG: hypothetical protein ACOX7O_04090 [Oscillospiraceae bacterium]
MPKIGRMTDTQRAMADDLRKLYGGAMTLTQIGESIGVDSPHTARKWAADIPYCVINGRKKYLVGDVARKLGDCRVGV